MPKQHHLDFSKPMSADERKGLTPKQQIERFRAMQAAINSASPETLQAAAESVISAGLVPVQLSEDQSVDLISKMPDKMLDELSDINWDGTPSNG